MYTPFNVIGYEFQPEFSDSSAFRRRKKSKSNWMNARVDSSRCESSSDDSSFFNPSGVSARSSEYWSTVR